MTQEVEIGIFVNSEEGLRFFGIEDVNKLLIQGAHVISIEPGGAIMEQSHSDSKDVEVTMGVTKI
jgi:hypothetical protein